MDLGKHTFSKLSSEILGYPCNWYGCVGRKSTGDSLPPPLIRCYLEPQLTWRIRRWCLYPHIQRRHALITYGRFGTIFLPSDGRGEHRQQEWLHIVRSLSTKDVSMHDQRLTAQWRTLGERVVGYRWSASDASSLIWVQCFWAIQSLVSVLAMK